MSLSELTEEGERILQAAFKAALPRYPINVLPMYSDEEAEEAKEAVYNLRCYIASLERTIGGITLLPVTGDPTATTTHPNVAPRRRYQ